MKNPSKNISKSDVLYALLLFVIVVIMAIWVGQQAADGNITILLVFIAATITALTTGFGAFPFIFFKNINKNWLVYGNALAAGLMLGASIGLVYEGFGIADVSMPGTRTIIGLLLGVILVILAHKALDSRKDEFSIGKIKGANAIKMLMIVGIMTVHSFAEGIGVGVAYGDSTTFGVFISVAIAIHNIPEGLAISLILIPRGSSIKEAAGWSIFSSLPQPLMAVPAFMFVLTFKPFLPIGLGLAAGAMFWMVFKELLPEALAEIPTSRAWAMMILTGLGMILFQLLIH